MKGVVADTSIVKNIWSTTDITLFIFAGAAAEFALNKQVDWLYFTGKLPGDPIARLFSTVKYAQHIIFKKETEALASINTINSIHHQVEAARGMKITNEGYQDVLYMLIHYSIAAFELLERKLTSAEKDEIVETFARIGQQMHIQGLPEKYDAWKTMYARQLQTSLANTNYTRHLFLQYKKHLGIFRYWLVLDIQRALVPKHVNGLLHLGRPRLVLPLITCYRLIRRYSFHKQLILSMVPQKFKADVAAMDKSA